MRQVVLGASSKASVGLAILISVVAVSQGQSPLFASYLVLDTSFGVVAVR